MNRAELSVEFAVEGLRFDIYYQVLPSSILPQLARMRHCTVAEAGAVFESGDNRAHVIADLDENAIHITVIGSKSTHRDLLSEIRSNLAAIHASLPGIAFSEEIPAPGFPGISIRSFLKYNSHEDMNGLHELCGREFAKMHLIQRDYDGYVNDKSPNKISWTKAFPDAYRLLVNSLRNEDAINKKFIGKLKDFYERVKNGQDCRKKIAIVAVCRKLLCIMRAMLRDNEKFNEALAGRICRDGKQIKSAA